MLDNCDDANPTLKQAIKVRLGIHSQKIPARHKRRRNDDSQARKATLVHARAELQKTQVELANTQENCGTHGGNLLNEMRSSQPGIARRVGSTILTEVAHTRCRH